jgi:hypothetical protein
MNKCFVVCAIVFCLSFILGGDLAAVDVTPGFDPTATLTGTVRYQNFNSAGAANKEIFVGIPSLAGAATGDVNWGGNPINKCVQISYNGSGTLTTVVANAATPCVFTSPLVTVTKTGLSITTVNYFEITVKKASSAPGTSNSFNNVKLDTDSLGSFTVTSTATTKWKVTGIEKTTGFVLVGNVSIVGNVGGTDTNYVQVDVGSVVPPDTEGPITSNVVVNPQPVIINGEATVTATVDDSTTGGNTIESADYSVNGGADASMAAQDGAFDEVAEDVEATFTATQLGNNEVCVHGTDSLNNVGDPTCQTFCVTYSFDGFYSPVDNEFVNLSRAGQAVPAKWRLTDADDVPIEDPASFDGLFSYEIDCDDLTGDPTDSVEEDASGSSGLQYNGDGYWQFNWKTPKTYAGTCRAMYIKFNGNCATSPVATFKFKN